MMQDQEAPLMVDDRDLDRASSLSSSVDFDDGRQPQHQQQRGGANQSADEELARLLGPEGGSRREESAVATAAATAAATATGRRHLHKQSDDDEEMVTKQSTGAAADRKEKTAEDVSASTNGGSVVVVKPTATTADIGGGAGAASGGGGSIRGRGLSELLVSNASVFLEETAPAIASTGVALFRTGATQVRHVLRGSWLPLMGDLPRNNIRSRPLLGLFYCFGAAVVSFFVLLMYLIGHSEAWNMRWSVPPPTATPIYPGVPMTIAVRIYDQANKGISGQLAQLSLFAASDFSLAVSMRDGSEYVDRSVFCSEWVAHYYQTMFDDRFFCAPHEQGMLLNRAAVTDDDGVAFFQDVVIASASSGSYVLFAEVWRTSYYVTQLVNIATDVKSLAVTAQLPNTYNAPIDVVAASVSSVDTAISASSTHSFLSVNATVVWSSPASLPRPTTIGASLVALTMDSKGSLAAIPLPRVSVAPLTGVLFDNNVALATPIEETTRGGNSSITSSTSTDGDEGLEDGESSDGDVDGGLQRFYSAELVFSNVAILAANTAQPYFGVTCMGKTIPLSAQQPQGTTAQQRKVSSASKSSDHQIPSQLVLPFTLATPVAEVVITETSIETIANAAAASTGDVREISEAAEFSVVAVVKDKDGAPLKGRSGYITALPAETNGPRWGTHPGIHPGIRPKMLLNGVSLAPTDADGVLRFPNVMFSSVSAVGAYRVYVIVDGVTAVWSAAATGATGVAISDSLLVNVTSRVDPAMCSVSWGGLTGGGVSAPSTPEVVGIDETNGDIKWALLPLVTVRSSSGSPIPGKEAVIVSANGSSPTFGVSGFSGNAGECYFVYVHTTVADGGGGSYSFHVVIDGIIVHTFTRNLVLPANETSSSSSSSAAATTCAYVDVLHVPPLLVSGGGSGNAGSSFMQSNRNNVIVLQVVNAMGDPVAGVQPYFVSLLDGSRWLISATSNSSGLLEAHAPHLSFFTPAGAAATPRVSPRPFFEQFSVACSGAATMTPIVAVYRSRVSHAEVKLLRQGDTSSSSSSSSFSFSFTVGVPDWSSADAVRFPISIGVKPVYTPAYMDLMLTRDYPAGVASGNVSSPQTVTQSVSISNTTWVSGMFGFIATVDGGAEVPFYANIVLPSRVADVQIVASAFAFGPISAGWQFMNSPVLRVTDSNKQPVPNIRLFAQVGRVVNTTNPNATTIEWLDFTADPPSVQYAYLFSMHGGSPMLPLSYTTNSNGTAAIDGLLLDALAHDTYVHLRYCVATDIPSSSADDGGSDGTTQFHSICAEEEFTIGPVSVLGSLSYSVSTTSVVAPAGQPLPAITIIAKRGSIFGNPSRLMKCFAMPRTSSEINQTSYYSESSSYSSSFLSFPATSGNRKPGEFWGNYGILTLTNSLVVRPETEDGTYYLQFACPGGLTPLLTVVVSSVPLQLTATKPPPRHHSSVKQALTMTVNLRGPSLRPLQDVPVEILVTSTADMTCSGAACGVLDEESTLYARTNKNGDAFFSFVFSAASTGDYEVLARAASLDSSVALQQRAAKELSILSNVLGMSQESIGEYLRRQQNGDAKNLAAAESEPSSVSEAEHLVSYMRSNAAMLPSGEVERRNSAQRIASSIFFGRSPSLADDDKVSSKSIVGISNPVAFVEIVRQPPMNTFTIEPDPRDVLGKERPQRQFLVDGNSAPVLRLLDSSRQPVHGASLQAAVYPADSPVALQFAVQTSNERGLVVFATTIIASEIAEFRLVFSSLGGGQNITAPLAVVRGTVITPWQWLKYLSGIIVLYFSPMLFMSVPLSRTMYSFASVAAVIAMMATIFALEPIVPRDRYIWGYYYYVCAVGCLVLLGTLVVATMDVLSRHTKKFYHLRFVNDEQKAENTFRYTKWLVTTRVEDQRPKSWEKKGRLSKLGDLSASRARKAKNKAEDFVDRTIAYVERKIFIHDHSKKREEKDISVSSSEKKNKEGIDNNKRKSDNEQDDADQKEKEEEEEDVQLQREHPDRVAAVATQKEKQIREKFLYNQGALQTVQMPPNFIIVMGITSVLVILVNYVLSLLYVFNASKIEDVKNLLPNIDKGVSDFAQLSNVFTEVMSHAMVGLADAYPQYASLTMWTELLRGTDLLSPLVTLRNILSGILANIEAAFVVGAVLSTLCVIGTIVLTFWSVDSMIWGVRRGTIKVRPNFTMRPLENYIGLHCSIFVTMQIAVFFLVFFIYLLLAVDEIRDYIWFFLKPLIVAFLIATVIRLTLQRVMVGWFLTNGVATVIRPELYAAWHFAGLILGIFAGPMAAVMRLVTGVVFMTGVSAKLNTVAYPAAVGFLDKAHKGFMAAIVVEARNSNPIYLTFAALLLTERELCQTLESNISSSNDEDVSGSSPDKLDSLTAPADKRKGSDNGTFEMSPEDADGLMKDNLALSACLRNTCRLCLRWMMKTPALSLRLQPQQQQASEANSSSWCDFAEFRDPVRRRRLERVRTRWWLLLLLYFNPSLRRLRKHFLVIAAPPPPPSASSGALMIAANNMKPPPPEGGAAAAANNHEEKGGKVDGSGCDSTTTAAAALVVLDGHPGSADPVAVGDDIRGVDSDADDDIRRGLRLRRTFKRASAWYRRENLRRPDVLAALVAASSSAQEAALFNSADGSERTLVGFVSALDVPPSCSSSSSLSASVLQRMSRSLVSRLHAATGTSTAEACPSSSQLQVITAAALSSSSSGRQQFPSNVVVAKNEGISDSAGSGPALVAAAGRMAGQVLHCDDPLEAQFHLHVEGMRQLLRQQQEVARSAPSTPGSTMATPKRVLDYICGLLREFTTRNDLPTENKLRQKYTDLLQRFAPSNDDGRMSYNVSVLSELAFHARHDDNTLNKQEQDDLKKDKNNNMKMIPDIDSRRTTKEFLGRLATMMSLVAPVVVALRLGTSPSQRFICGCLVAGPLLCAIYADVLAIVELDVRTQCRAAHLQVMEIKREEQKRLQKKDHSTENTINVSSKAAASGVTSSLAAPLHSSSSPAGQQEEAEGKKENAEKEEGLAKFYDVVDPLQLAALRNCFLYSSPALASPPSTLVPSSIGDGEGEAEEEDVGDEYERHYLQSTTTNRHRHLSNVLPHVVVAVSKSRVLVPEWKCSVCGTVKEDMYRPQHNNPASQQQQHQKLTKNKRSCASSSTACLKPGDLLRLHRGKTQILSECGVCGGEVCTFVLVPRTSPTNLDIATSSAVAADNQADEVVVIDALYRGYHEYSVDVFLSSASSSSSSPLGGSSKKGAASPQLLPMTRIHRQQRRRQRQHCSGIPSMAFHGGSDEDRGMSLAQMQAIVREVSETAARHSGSTAATALTATTSTMRAAPIDADNL